MTKLVKEWLDNLPSQVQDLLRREVDGVAQPGDELQPPDQGQAGGQVLQEVLVQQQHLQYTPVKVSFYFTLYF